jgi:phosphoribosylaminoimidazole carboxylase (NCAIR synthetase)
MSRSMSTILSLAFVVVFGVSSMALYSKITQHGTRLDGFVSVQEAARQALAKQLREEATHHQGKHATELGALEEKVRLLTEQLDALKAEASTATAKEAQQITAVAALEREAARAVQQAAEQAGQIATLEAGQARINSSLDQALAPLAAKVPSAAQP